MVDPELLKILVCPACHHPVAESSTLKELVCRNCNRAYPIRDGIPVMLIEESRVLSE